MERKIALWATPLLVSALLLLAGCADTPPPQTSKAPITSKYKIGPGDSLNIYVRDNPNLSMGVPVRPDGKISIPLVQNMRAAGKTPSELAGDLEKSLSKYVRNPNVTVIVTGFHGTYSDQIKVVGQAVKPESLPYSSGMTLLDVMIQVGGLTQEAAGNRAKLVRTVKGNKHTYSVNIADLLNGDIKDNVKMRPGDVVIIPRSLF